VILGSCRAGLADLLSQVPKPLGVGFAYS